MSFRTKQTVERITGGYFDDDGMWNTGTAETFEIMASIQPLNGDERAQYTNMLPEGATQYSAIKIYSNTQLQVEAQEQDGNNGTEADIVLWRNKRYKVVFCEEWQSNVISHFRMIAWEVGAYADSDSEVSS